MTTEHEQYTAMYTSWIQSETTKAVLKHTEQAVKEQYIYRIDDSTLQGAAKAHWFRAGMEAFLQVLRGQMTTEALEKMRARQTQTEPDFGAEKILADDLMKPPKGGRK
jgi:hypothetical protein